MFVDRDRELAFLERAWSSQRAELLVVYGRRRVGKTALLRQFCLGRSQTFWVASLSSEALLRQSFTQVLWQSTHPDRPDPGFTYATWQRAFEASPTWRRTSGMSSSLMSSRISPTRRRVCRLSCSRSGMSGCNTRALC